MPLPGGGPARVRRVKPAPPPALPWGAGPERPGGPGRGLTSAGGASRLPRAHTPPGSRRAQSPSAECAAQSCAMARSGPAPLLALLLAGLALRGAARVAADGGFSLHPPYFNLAEGARITASATCGEEAPVRGTPRPTEDLYCKLVGGPVAGGDPNQTIQVSACLGQRRCGRDGVKWGTPSPGPPPRGGSASVFTTPARLGREHPRPDRSPRDPPLRFHISGEQKGPQLGHSGSPENCASLWGPRAAGAGGGALAPSPWRPRVPGSRGGGAWWPPPAACGEGADRSASPKDRLEPAGVGMGLGWGVRGHTGEVEAAPTGGAALQVGEGGKQREFELGMGIGAPILGGLCSPRVMRAASCGLRAAVPLGRYTFNT